MGAGLEPALKPYPYRGSTHVQEGQTGCTILAVFEVKKETSVCSRYPHQLAFRTRRNHCEGTIVAEEQIQKDAEDERREYEVPELFSSSVLGSTHPFVYMCGVSIVLVLLLVAAGIFHWLQKPSASTQRSHDVVTSSGTDALSQNKQSEIQGQRDDLQIETAEPLPTEQAGIQPEIVQLLAVNYQRDDKCLLIFLELSGVSTYEVHRLRQPDRIYIDFYHAQFAPGWDHASTLPTDLITKVRSSFIRDQRSRVVFDLVRPVEFLVVGPNVRHRITLCLY
jgi:hypothetical protein